MSTTTASIEKFIEEKGSDHIPTFGGGYEGGIHIQQVPDELAPCIEYLLANKAVIHNYLEIGVAAGGTTFVFNHYFSPDNMVLIDDNSHPKARLRQSIIESANYLEILGSSTDPEIIKKSEKEYDLIIIDGDHSFEGVMNDFNNYSKYLKQGGYIIFHDSFFDNLGVKPFVKELKKNKDYKFINEYISKKYNKCGVALFKKKEEDV